MQSSVKVVSVNAMVSFGEQDVKLHLFFISPVDGVGSQIHAPASLLRWETNQCVGTRSGLGVWDLLHNY
jgi:hypothetical protein